MIKLYSNGCPKCRILETKFNEKSYPYIKISDTRLIMSVAENNGISAFPFCETEDGEIKNYIDMITILNQLD
ncbi:MAG: hypothetical protein PF569_06510 [Candidatus Woesearchaeota archaeon]|jgi:hypothetical protein|nr:hypothetical protein [Candidatus Woesearchaeota archaeon]